MILIDNRLQVAKIRLAYIVSLAISVMFLAFSFSRFADKQLGLIVAGIILLIFVYLLIIKPEYVFIQIVKNSKLIVRTYHAFPMFRQYKAYEVALNSLIAVETKKNPFSSKPFFRLAVRNKKAVGKYPWLSLSIVSKRDFNKFADYINRNVKVEKKVKTI